jgi:16S rRNA (guanine527-N7)-methyltransferase
MDPQPTPEFLEAAADFGIAFEDQDLPRLARYLGLLLDANTRFNLTAITDPGEAWMRHIFDSLTLLGPLSELPEGALVADVGSGGGAPAIPLAIVMPGARFTLIESTGKKAQFLRETIAALALRNAAVIDKRAEEAGQERATRERFDAVTARAVGRINVVAELCAPLAKVGGVVLLIKGAKAQEELDEAQTALHRLHLAPAGIIQTPTGRIVAREKQRPTPRMYPRRPGEPKRDPLK